jgi:hypothetical protein
MIRLSNADDLREDLELTVIELRLLGVAPSSVRRYVNAAIRAFEAGEDPDGYIATSWLRKHWKRDQEPSETRSRPLENAVWRPRTQLDGQGGTRDWGAGSDTLLRSRRTPERVAE